MGTADLWTALGAAPLRRDGVRVHGPEAVEYLQGQLSQDIEALTDGASAPTLLLQPNGKVVAWLRATRTSDDEVLLDVDHGFGEAVLARLRRFLLRTKADLDLEEWSGWAVRGPGAGDVAVPPGARGLPAHWPGVDGVDLLARGEPFPTGLPEVDEAVLHGLRIECGVPAMGAELTDDTIPAEAGQWLIDASASFSKGCYTGQELVARIDSRGGNVPRPIRGLLVERDSVPVGAEVRAVGGSSPAGAVTSSGRSATLGPIALARLARAVGVGDGVELCWDDEPAGVQATVVDLPMR
jgi:folate-binding protein YgfZ